jgi:tetratricopeptide (TPR) repeat protein
MKSKIRYIVHLTVVITCLMFMNTICYGQINIGEKAHMFSLKDLKSISYDLSDMEDKPIMMLYFFDAESRPSQEGLLSLHHLTKKYHEAGLIVWAITLSDIKSISGFVKNSGISFPVLLDDSNTSKLYNAEMILPTVCILGPDLHILDYFQGGGETTEKMMVRVAERQLQRKQTMMAKAISDEVIKNNPANVKAKAVRGYASLQEGNLKDAESSFKELSREDTQGRVLGNEGLAAVYVKKNQPEEALRMVREVEKEAPERSYIHLIEGDILYAQNKKKEAEEAYKRSIMAKEAEPYQEALSYNQLGRLYASSGQYERARELYDKAVSIDPYYIIGTTNKGITYEKEGKLDKALEAYQQALAIEKNDTFAVVLANKVQKLINLQTDNESNKRVDKLVSDLVERYNSQQEKPEIIEDAWTSPPMVMSFIDFQEKGGLTERDGFSSVLSTELTNHLNKSGRLQVVERVLIERLLEELNLGSSDLADTETALKLGKVLAAKIIVTGTVFHLPEKTLLSMRLIDTETSAIPQVTIWQIEYSDRLDNELFKLNREILKTVILKYPLRGYIVKSDGDQFIINLGSNQGVVTGTKFDVIEEKEPIKYKGKVLHSSPQTVALFEVVTVEPDLSHVRVINNTRELKSDDKIQEKIESAAL